MAKSLCLCSMFAAAGAVALYFLGGNASVSISGCLSHSMAQAYVLPLDAGCTCSETFLMYRMFRRNWIRWTPLG